MVVAKQKRKEYIGHSSHVTRVRFTFDDSFLVSTGGNDKSIIIWKTDFGCGKKADLKNDMGEEGADEVDVPTEKVKKTKPKEPEPEMDPDDVFEAEKVDHGD